MNTFGLVLTIVVLLGVALLILLFERKRARRIQRDLKDMAAERPARRPEDQQGRPRQRRTR